MNSYFKCEGLDELIKYFEGFSNDPAFKQLEKKAVKEGSNIVKESIANSLESVNGPYRKGYSTSDLVAGNPKKKNDEVISTIGWNGAHQRWRLAHLNEFGYSKGGKTYEPAMIGRIEKGIENSKEKYIETVSKTIKKGVSQLNGK